ncbi:hypothetical protein C8R48DRAFT_771323 [Suillus tomentosus]|nr:hypothetical protein C8R48DRAFT_771323 [Suillus tomentosus]
MPTYTPPAETDSPLSPLTSRDPTPVDNETGPTKTPLYRCLQAYMSSSGALTAEVCDSVPFANNPRPMSIQMGDKAEYWADKDGDLLVFKFPAILDVNGMYTRIGPYFGMPDSGLDVGVLRKARAHFELHFLSPEDEESDQYPEEVLTMSARFFDLLSALITDVEDARNAGVPDSARAIVSPFMRAYSRAEEDFYVLLVQSDLLFRDLPSEQQASSIVPRVKRGDIGKSGVLISPSKAKAAKRLAMMGQGPSGSGGNGGNGGPSSGNPAAPDVLRIRDLHDPLARYAGLGPLRETKVEIPEVRDGHGVLIHPRDYAEKLAGARFVEVEVYIKLWSIPAKLKKDVNMSDRDRFGSRNYQMILRRMQLLPCEAYLKPKILDPKGKRKASEDAEDQSPAKKNVFEREAFAMFD